MSNPYRFLLFVSLAGAALSSCSRTNYAFQSTAPAYLGTERVSTAAAPSSALVEAEVPALTATATTTPTPAVEMPEARVAARAFARSATQVVPQASAVAVPVAVNAPTTRMERHAIKEELKRQLRGAPTGIAAEGKSQLVAALLCFFLGGLGIHDFYLGRPGKGILQILLTLLFGIGVILVLIDFVRILIGTEKPKDGEYAKKL